MSFWKPGRATELPEHDERFHVFNESRSLIAAYLLPKLMELYPSQSCDFRAELALEQSNAFLAARKRAREKFLKSRRERGPA